MQTKTKSIHKFPYEWTLEDAKFTKDKGKVFSCFSCGGGSTMGYKLAGFDVIGCNEIDPKMMEVYKLNHNSKYSYLESIQTFKLRKDLPEELYNLDILDGSPPCSSFSMAGNREKDWGKEKKFREGQAEQILDNLFFDFIDLAKELQPKVVIAENVKGLMMGKAKGYVRRIYASFKNAGYQLRIRPYLLDASRMGVPQRRERVFFIAIRNDLADRFMESVDMFQKAPKLELEFNELNITFSQINNGNIERKKITSNSELKYLSNKTESGVWQTEKDSLNGKLGAVGFGYSVIDEKVPLTVLAGGSIAYTDNKSYISNGEISKIGTYPLDYNYLENKPQYLIGMSVPPVMTAQIASNVYDQWLSKL